MTDITAALSAMDSGTPPPLEPVSSVPKETEIDQLRKQLAEKESQLKQMLFTELRDRGFKVKV